MIIIDDRAGSVELQPLFPHGMTRLERLEFGDFSWIGNGEGECPWVIGVERKTIGDLISSMTTGRFSGHQLIGLLNTYNVVYLVVEGRFRPNPQTGTLETYKKGNWSPLSHGRRSYLYNQVVNYCNTLSTLCGVQIVRTFTDNETVHSLLALYHWWTDKPWEEHGSHLEIYTPPPKRVPLIDPPLIVKFATQIEGVGWKLAHRIGKSFSSVESMILSKEEEWWAIPGIGKEKARRIVSQIRGEG